MSEYRLQVLDSDLIAIGEVELECETDVQAILLAFSVDSPHGHVLLRRSELIGRFEAGPLLATDYRLELEME
jgi:hypothetical protein